MGIAMMVEVLAAALGANAASMARLGPQAREGGGSSRVGAFFWFVDPGAFGSRALFDSYMAQWTGFYLASAPDAARLPGQRAAELERVALKTGIVLSDATVRELRVLGDNLGVPFPA
jgi:LDH2 family malate/lactate/ureidoglycolate dehydrogenase